MPELPQAVSRVLDAAGIAWSLADPETAPAPMNGCPVVLKDAAGWVQVLIAANTLLDLDALNQFAGRELSAAPEDEVAALCAPHGLQSLPAIPAVLELPVLADQRLLAGDELSLDAGAGGARVQMSADALRVLLQTASASVGSFCVPLAELAPAASAAANDEAEIGSAVARFKARRIRQRLEDTLDLPALPEIARRIIQIRANPDASVSDLAQVVEIDPSLSAQVVR